MNPDLSENKLVKWLKFCIYGASLFSTCSRKQFMAVLIDGHGSLIGFGFNGPPSKMPHCIDGGCPRANSDEEAGKNYDACTAIHAEMNAIVRSNYDARKNGVMLIVNGPPCSMCAKIMVNSGVKVLIHLEDDEFETWPDVKNFLIEAGLDVRSFRIDEL